MIKFINFLKQENKYKGKTMKKILLITMILATILFMNCKEDDKEEGEEGKGKDKYYTVTYHKNTKYNNYSDELEFRNKVIKDEDITGEPPVDPALYKTGEKIYGEVKQEYYGPAFKGVGSGTLELEGYEIIGWARRLTDADINDVASFHGYKSYTENAPNWFPPVPRGGWEVYHANIDLDPVWRRKPPTKEE
jgi:hypothetical protein